MAEGPIPMYMLAALTDYLKKKGLEGVRGTWCGNWGVRRDLGGDKDALYTCMNLSKNK